MTTDPDRGSRATALAAIERYDLEVVRCEPLASFYNTFFRVETRDGSRLALRVSPARRVHRAGSDEAEAAWLDALHRDGVVTVPRFVRARDGGAGVSVAIDDASPRRCAVMTWVDGRRLHDEMTVEGVREMGRVSARLHGHVGATTAPPTVPAFDHVVYWEIVVRFGELSPAQRSVVDPALERAQAAIDALWGDPPHPPQLLHGDVGPSNVLRTNDGMAILDFEDLVWGFAVQDLAITVADLSREDDPSLVPAFRAGYDEVRPWPATDEAAFDALVAARWVHQIDLGLNVRKPGLDAFLDDLVARIDARAT